MSQDHTTGLPYEHEDTQATPTNASDINLNVSISPQISPVQSAKK